MDPMEDVTPVHVYDDEMNDVLDEEGQSDADSDIQSTPTRTYHQSTIYPGGTGTATPPSSSSVSMPSSFPGMTAGSIMSHGELVHGGFFEGKFIYLHFSQIQLYLLPLGFGDLFDESML
jgi:hypothetical protein